VRKSIEVPKVSISFGANSQRRNGSANNAVKKPLRKLTSEVTAFNVSLFHKDDLNEALQAVVFIISCGAYFRHRSSAHFCPNSAQSLKKRRDRMKQDRANRKFKSL
jgi:hypothetical protein